MDNCPIKVLITDDTAAFGVRLASQLREYGYHTITRKSTESMIMHAIMTEDPDVVITDLTLRDTDAVALMNELKQHSQRFPHFIVASDIKNSFIEKQVIDGGAECLMIKPISTAEIVKVITSFSDCSQESRQTNTIISVTDTIQKLGVPAHIKGYHYLRAAILLTIEDPFLLSSVTKQLYPRIANKYNTTPSRVERAIRHAIETTWDRADRNNLRVFFGCAYRGRPTNSEFIAFISDRIRLGAGISMSFLPQLFSAAL